MRRFTVNVEKCKIKIMDSATNTPNNVATDFNNKEQSSQNVTNSQSPADRNAKKPNPTPKHYEIVPPLPTQNRTDFRQITGSNQDDQTILQNRLSCNLDGTKLAKKILNNF